MLTLEKLWTRRALGDGGAKWHQTSQIAIPQGIAQGPQRGAQGELRRRLKHDIRFVALLETVVRDARVRMVDMVKPDIAREPLEDPGQFEMRAAAQRRRVEIPTS